MGLSRARPLYASPVALTLAVSQKTLWNFLKAQIPVPSPWNDSVGLGCSPESCVNSTGDSDNQLILRTTLLGTHCSIFMQPKHSNIVLSEHTFWPERSFVIIFQHDPQLHGLKNLKKYKVASIQG